MRAMTLAVALFVALLFPKVSNAQAYPPEASAAAAEWQVDSAPIVVNGVEYFATRAFRLFDAGVMAQAGVYMGVPVYADVTLEPYSIVYVPVSRSNMRVYERRRDGALAGTTGSRTPSFPVEIASDTVRANQAANALAPGTNAAAFAQQPSPSDVEAADARAAGTRGSAVPPAASTSGLMASDVPRPGRTRIETVPAVTPSGAHGVWLQFNGERWYADGAAVRFSPDRFEPIGEYHGFPVYRDKQGTTPNGIWVSVVKNGPVAPYTRR
jgi:hypothetical protein